MTLQSILQLLRGPSRIVYSSDDDSEDDCNDEEVKHTVATTLLVSLRDIKSNSAKAVLEMASLVAPKEIPASLFSALLQK